MITGGGATPVEAPTAVAAESDADVALDDGAVDEAEPGLDVEREVLGVPSVAALFTPGPRGAA